ncbi:hypothetical protein [Pigmentiphaga daeguensis]|uniref:Uncharacterized protein n=1 Tax=Pigmentiphaga daeguensis TaxID=414049 RepID=A0ABP3N103_9BURK
MNEVSLVVMAILGFYGGYVYGVLRTRRKQTPTARELNMAVLVKRLARAVRVSDPVMYGIALDALKRWGLAGSPLREGGE